MDGCPPHSLAVSSLTDSSVFRLLLILPLFYYRPSVRHYLPLANSFVYYNLSGDMLKMGYRIRLKTNSIPIYVPVGLSSNGSEYMRISFSTLCI